jgi:hypothetical protein
VIADLRTHLDPQFITTPLSTINVCQLTRVSAIRRVRWGFPNVVGGIVCDVPIVTILEGKKRLSDVLIAL